MTQTYRFQIETPLREREQLIAELYALGTDGLEELDSEEGEGCSRLIAYFSGAAPPEREVLGLAAEETGIRVQGPEVVQAEDWERVWLAGLEPRKVGPLWIRPSWCDSAGTPEIVIDPQQAFGSGEHASTRLALWFLLETLSPGDRILDLGTGSGILALGALRLGAAAALAVDFDPDACQNAAANALRNALGPRIVCGTLDAIRLTRRFDVAVANLLLENLRPWIPGLLRHASRVLVLSGYLGSQRDQVEALILGAGWRLCEERAESQSGELWCASCWRHSRDLQSSSSSSSVRSKR